MTAFEFIGIGIERRQVRRVAADAILIGTHGCYRPSCCHTAHR